MKASELRIGNFFNKIDRSKEVHLPINIPLKVITLGFEGADCLHYEQNPALVSVWDNVSYRDMSPIPLTEEWLRKMWCKKLGNNHWTTLNGIQFNFNAENHCGLITFGSRHVHFYYVHTFQNIISLTGQELTLKSEPPVQQQ